MCVDTYIPPKGEILYESAVRFYKRSEDKTIQAPLGRGSLLSKEKIVLISTALLKYSLFLSVSSDKGRKDKGNWESNKS